MITAFQLQRNQQTRTALPRERARAVAGALGPDELAACAFEALSVKDGELASGSERLTALARRLVNEHLVELVAIEAVRAAVLREAAQRFVAQVTGHRAG